MGEKSYRTLGALLAFERDQHGFEALSDRTRRPVRYASNCRRRSRALIVILKRGNPIGAFARFGNRY